MNRETYIQYEASLDDSGIKNVDINVGKPLTALECRLELTGGAGGALTKRLMDETTLIEVVDGSHTLFRMKAPEAWALSYAYLGLVPRLTLATIISGVEQFGFYIPFGLFLYDKDHWLQPTNYDNLTLKVTSAFTINGTDGYTTNTGKLTVIAHTMEGPVNANAGVVTHKSIHEWTSATSGDETIDLPRDFPYVHLLQAARKTLLSPEEVLSNLKLSIDTDRIIPFDKKMKDILIENEARLPQLSCEANILEGDDGSFLTHFWRKQQFIFDTLVDDYIATVEAQDQEKIQIGLYNLTTPGTPALQATAQILGGHINGYCPQACVGIPFGNIVRGDMLDPKDYQSVRLLATQAAAGACRTVLSQLAPR